MLVILVIMKTLLYCLSFAECVLQKNGETEGTHLQKNSQLSIPCAEGYSKILQSLC